MSSREAANDNEQKGVPTPRITLYVAGDGPSSQRARQFLEKLLEQSGGKQRFTLVDVLIEPSKALEVGLIATPMLIVDHCGKRQRYAGDLSGRASVLREMLEKLTKHSDETGETG